MVLRISIKNNIRPNSYPNYAPYRISHAHNSGSSCSFRIWEPPSGNLTDRHIYEWLANSDHRRPREYPQELIGLLHTYIPGPRPQNRNYRRDFKSLLYPVFLERVCRREIKYESIDEEEGVSYIDCDTVHLINVSHCF